MRKFLSILALCLSATACIYPYTPDLDEAPEGVLAVDANITIGDVSTVRLGSLVSLFPKSDSVWQPADFSDAVVYVEDDAGNTYQGVRDGRTTPSDPWSSSYSGDYYGDYFSDPYNPTFSIPTENAPADRRYRLVIKALGGVYTSDWSDIPEAPVIESIDFMADDTRVTVAVSVSGGQNGTGYLLLSYDEAWEFHAEFEKRYSFIPPQTIQEEYFVDYSHYWCWGAYNNNMTYPIDYSGLSENGIRYYPLFSFARKDGRNHRRYCVNLRAKTLTPASYRFLKNLEQGSSGGDNLFTPNPGEIAGNLRCESDPERTVLGYVIVSRTAFKRAWLDSRYLKGSTPSLSSLLFIIPKFYLDYYGYGYLPLRENPKTDYNPEEEGPYGWGPRYCYDCVAAGGTLTKPDYWDSYSIETE